MAPRVSVCIPVHNSARYVGETIRSVLAQDFHDFELVVCDNASTDGTREVGESFRDARVRVAHDHRLVGQSANWNRCLREARGEFIIVLHGDDLLRPTYLSHAVAFLEREASAALVFCAVDFIDETSRTVGTQKRYDRDTLVPQSEAYRRLILEGCIVNPAGVLMRRSAREAVGEFTEEILWGVDWHMWCRFALHGPLGYLATPLAAYRLHGQSATSGVMATGRNGRDERWMLEDVLRRAPAAAGSNALPGPVFRAAAHRAWCFAEEACQRGDGKAARAQLRVALSFHRWIALQYRFPALFIASFLGYRWFERARGFRTAL
jgi:glycosyltransferase involved in cell wall biosynthesis